MKLALITEKLDYELAPPHMHRRNAAERAIRTFKNHFLAGLAACPPHFPITEWDRLIPQAQLTLSTCYDLQGSIQNYLLKPTFLAPMTSIELHSSRQELR